MFHELGKQQQQQDGGVSGPGTFQEPLTYLAIRAASGGSGRAEASSGDHSGPTRHPCPRPSDLPLLQRPEVAETYVRLLCRFAPREVLPFLSAGTVTASINLPSSSASSAITAAGVSDGVGAGNGPSSASSGMPEGYDVRRCIVFCREAGVVDAEAFLHERLGELEEAGRLYLAEVQRCGWEVVCM